MIEHKAELDKRLEEKNKKTAAVELQRLEERAAQLREKLTS